MQFVVNQILNRSFQIFSFVLIFTLLSLTSYQVEAKPGGKNAPNISIVTPNNRATVDGTNGVSFTAVANDSVDGDLSNYVDWHSSLDGRLPSGSTVSAILSDGKHTITATVRNSSNVSNRKRITIFVESTIVINSTPTVSITSPENGFSTTLGNTILFSANASDVEDGNLSEQVSWRSNLIGQIGIGQTISAALTEGDHTITASVNDSEGELSESSISVRVITQTNNAPSIIILTPSTESQFTTENIINFSATASDDEDGILDQEIIWESNIDGILETGESIFVNLSAGAHIIKASVLDSQGLISTETINLYVTTPSSESGLTVSWIAPTQNTDGSALENLSSFRIYYGESIDNLSNAIDINDAQRRSFQFDNLIAGVTYHFAVTAINSLGIESEHSQIISKVAQ